MIEDETFQRIVDTLLKDKKITQMVMFGSPGLRVAGKVFTFLWKGRLVLKLPEERVQQLMGSGDAKLFDPGHGRVSKTWVSVGPGRKREWPGLVKEAREFVASVSTRPRRRTTTRR